MYPLSWVPFRTQHLSSPSFLIYEIWEVVKNGKVHHACALLYSPAGSAPGTGPRSLDADTRTVPGCCEQRGGFGARLDHMLRTCTEDTVATSGPANFKHSHYRVNARAA